MSGKDKSSNLRPKMKNVEGLETEFKTWLIDEKENSQGTADTYWNRLKNLKYFDIFDWDQKPYFECDMSVEKIREISTYGDVDDVKSVLVGHLDSSIQDSHQRTVVMRYITFLREKASKDSNIPDAQQTVLLTRTAEIKTSLKEKEFNKNDMPNIDEHYLHKKEMIELLKKAEPGRARYWTTLYLLGCRYGELHLLTPEDIFYPSESQEEFGHVFLPDEKSQDQDNRRVPLMSPLTLRLLEDASVGEYSKNNKVVKEAYFPERDNDKENYQLGRRRGDKVYGLITDVDSIQGTRTVHSFRHIRVTDLMNDEYYNVSRNAVKRRSGHKNFKTTEHYEEANLRRKPRGLESYWEENYKGDEDVWEAFIEEVIEADGN